MSSPGLVFIAFEPRDGTFRGLLALEGLAVVKGDPEVLLRQATAEYAGLVRALRAMKAEIDSHRQLRTRLPARKVWRVGDAVLTFARHLESWSLRIDGLYDHVSRDVGLKRKWLEKALTLRRHLPDERLIPVTLNWGRLEKGTRKAAERLRRAQLANDRK